MKVVLFCGGQGLRIRDFSDEIPKPMVPIGSRPLLWHVMKYYAHYGHKDFVLCLGFKAEIIKRYFLEYDECVSNDFVLSGGGKKVHLLASDIPDWNITFVDTGLLSTVGDRLKAVEPFLEGEATFLCNYSDGLTDLPLPEYLEHFQQRDKIGIFLAVPLPQAYHVVSVDGDLARGIQPVGKSGLLINGGYFAFRREIFKFIEEGEDLAEQPFERLIRNEQLMAYKNPGFWACMDTFKDRQRLEELCTRGTAPWEVWKNAGHAPVDVP